MSNLPYSFKRIRADKIINKSDNEEIRGIKYFRDNPRVKSNFDITQNPTNNLYFGYVLEDVNGVNLGGLEFARYKGNNERSAKIICRCQEDDDFAYITCGKDANGIRYAIATSTSNQRNEGDDIVTRNWIPKDTRIVHIGGTEIITGFKVIQNRNLAMRQVDRALGDTWSDGNTASYSTIFFEDKNGKIAGEVELAYRNSGTTEIKIMATNPQTPGDTDDFAAVYVGYDSSGNKYASAPTALATANNTHIANTSWVRTYCSTTQRYLPQYTNVSELGRYIDLHYDNATAKYDYDCRIYCSAQGSAAGGGNLSIAANALYGPAPAADANDTRLATTKWVKDKGYLTSQTQLSLTNSGSGNAVTGISVSNHAITVTKGSTFLTSHQSLANYVTLNSEQTLTKGKVFWYWSAFKDQGEAYTAGAYNVIQFRDKNDLSYGLNKVFAESDGNTAYYQFVLLNPKNTSANCTLELTVTSSVWYFCPVSANDNVVNLGSGGRRWKQLFAGTTTISTSDKRYKNSIDDIPDDILDTWENVRWRQFKFNNADEDKPSDQVRLHTGLIAQDVDEVFKDKDLDISKYGLFCYDHWDAEKEILDKEGNVIREAMEEGDRYSIRYEEALCLEAAYQRRKNKQLEDKIKVLEDEIKMLKEAILNK